MPYLRLVITDLRKPSSAASLPRGAGWKHPVLGLGFRPFFLLAGLFGTFIVPLWLLVFAGKVTLPTHLWPTAWHAHEMVFGFAVAVLAGFLLTAVRNWTSQPTPSGAPLAALVALWMLGRVAVLFDGAIPHGLAAAVDLAFLPALALALARPIVKSKNWRNLAFVVLLLLLFGANLLFHVGPLAWTSRATKLGVDIIVLVIVVMGGRVIPSFTAGALGVEVRKRPLLDWASLVAMAIVTALELVPDAERVAGVAAIVAGVLSAARMASWRSLATRKQPILWVLHVGYAWIAVGLVLQGLAVFIPQWMKTAPTHALTVGAIGLLILGMTSRVSMGHTGRMLVVPPSMATAYGLLSLAALVRVAGPLVLPSAYLAELVLSGLLWAAAFGVFTVVYLPILTSPRVDGKPG